MRDEAQTICAGRDQDRRRLVQTAGCDCRIVGRGIGGTRSWRIAALPGNGRLACQRGRRGVPIGWSVRNVIIIARRAGPRRDITGHASGPARPMIGDIARIRTARPEQRAETNHHQHRNELPDVPDVHAIRWAAPRSSLTMHRACAVSDILCNRPTAPPLSRRTNVSLSDKMPTTSGIRARIFTFSTKQSYALMSRFRGRTVIVE